MAQIKIENGTTVITVEQAMKWYCWHELIEVMEKDEESLHVAVNSVPENIVNWEMMVLKKFLELTKHDLIIS